MKSYLLSLLKPLIGDLKREEFVWLVSASRHLSILSLMRTRILNSRIRLVSLVFGVLILLWMPLDIFFLPSDVWPGIILARIVSAAAFFLVGMYGERVTGLNRTLGLLLAMLMVPMLFFVFAYVFIGQHSLNQLASFYSTGYTLLPFVIVSGLSLFPLTAIECALFTLPVLAIQVICAMLNLPLLNWPNFGGSMWLLFLLTGTSGFSCLSQLMFLIVIESASFRDKLTECFSRGSGEELLSIQFAASIRSNEHFSLAFIDLDHFKSVNDEHGHDAGDKVLKGAVDAIQGRIRPNDIFVRWGGEEFLLLMPATTGEQARHVVDRLRAEGLGKRPEGNPVTASIGIAERIVDKTGGWHELIDIADKRMYMAKSGGRDRVVGFDVAKVGARA